MVTVRRVGALVAVALLAATGSVGQATGPTYGPDRVTMWRLHRTTATARQPLATQVEVGFEFGGADLRSALVMAPAEPVRGGWRWNRLLGHVATTVLEWHPSPAYPFAYARVGGTRVTSPDCPDPALCRSRNEGVKRSYPVAVRRGEDVVVAALNLDVRITALPPGWTAVRIRDVRASGGDLRVVQGWETERASGVYSFQYLNASVEHFAGPVEVAGGHYGSWAMATLPCNSAGLIVPPVVPALWRGAGVGSGTLAARPRSGPVVHQAAITCESGAPWAELAADGGPVTWRLDAEVTGFAVTPNRLLVLSLPKP